MRYMEFQKIADAVERLCIEAAYELPEDVLAALTSARQKESDSRAGRILDMLIENAEIARTEKLPLCQDSGIAVVFVEAGTEVALQVPSEMAKATLDDAINAGVKAGSEKGYLRKSVVAEPLDKRKNTDTNTPAIIHHSIVPGDRITLTVMLKGGGCENRSQFKMFKPTAEREEIIDWVLYVVKSAGADACPPLIVGVGIGGDFEYSCLLSKKALLRRLGTRNSEAFYAGMERELLQRINSLGIGPQGFGGDTTALDCMVEFAPCHIASLPVAVNIECHSHRHKKCVL